MVDIDAAIGFIVARGDAVDRARLSHLRTGVVPSAEVFEHVERGQAGSGGWPANPDEPVASIDATCFRLAELDDLSGLTRPTAVSALRWLAGRQRLDGSWEEDPALASSAPPWAQPGDPEARFYLTVNATYWLSLTTETIEDSPYAGNLERAGQAIVDQVDEKGGWPGFLVSGWLAAAVLRRTGWYYESARVLGVLTERVINMSASDTAQMMAALRRAGIGGEDGLVAAARERLTQTQRPDGAWPSDAAPAFDVHTTLTALRALR